MIVSSHLLEIGTAYDHKGVHYIYINIYSVVYTRHSLSDFLTLSASHLYLYSQPTSTYLLLTMAKRAAKRSRKASSRFKKSIKRAKSVRPSKSTDTNGRFYLNSLYLHI